MTTAKERHAQELAALRAEYDERVAELQTHYRAHLTNNKSAAFWFATCVVGVPLLIIGLCLGAVGMYAAQESMIPRAMEALSRGQMLEHFITKGNP